jgi:hypothetical protein
MVGRKLVGKGNDWREDGRDRQARKARQNTLNSRSPLRDTRDWGESGEAFVEEEVYKSCVYMHITTMHRWGCSRLSAWLSNKRHDMVLHCPAYDGVVVWPVAPIPGDFSDKSCMAHGFENMRKPRMRPLLKLPSTPPRQPKPDDALVQSHQQEHGTFYRFHSARVSKR